MMVEQNMLGKDASSQENVWKVRITRAMQLVLQHDELAVVLIFAIHVYVDWYLGLALSALLLAAGLLLIFFMLRSEQYPWVKPAALWLWIAFLLLAILPALRGVRLLDSVYYYFNSLVNALLVFWLGLLVAQDTASVRRLFKMLAFFAALLAIHTIIEARTGIVLFKTSLYDKSLNDLLHFPLGSTGIHRAEAFMLNPDTNGAFFAFMLLLPLGLFIDSATWRAKAFYLAEVILMALALLFTYSTGAWLSLAAGAVAFVIFVGSIRAGLQITAFLGVIFLLIVVAFPAQIYGLAQHAAAAEEWSLRLGVWQTAIRVILAFPLTGLGLGRYVYIARAEPYRVPAQFIPVYHPHNSYMEIAALGGIPLGLIFCALLGLALWMGWRNWRQIDPASRAVLSGGLASVLTLSFYSLNNAGWTLTPLLAGGWLILGAIASPLLLRKQKTLLNADKQDVAIATGEERGA
ncbi:MAG TPA: O-antigen ligase family protein [Ktedonobacteraceae bacterium]|nr:O-antigen ligase family protein [Ktedonobacteraceae bacterium]